MYFSVLVSRSSVLLHALLDSMVVILPATIHLGTVGLYLYLVMFSALVLALGIRMFISTVSSKSNRKEVSL